jgi:N-acetylglucosaminyldiphosphoundecaprenol N-acetyl-beta-D-mannosaminyltransferase
VLPASDSLPFLRIFGVPISRLGLDEAVKYCADRARARAGGYVCFVNVHTITEAHDHLEVRQALTMATLSVADGTPIVWVSRLRRKPVASRVCGPDFMAKFLLEFPGLSHGFIGGIPGQAEKLAKRFNLQAPCFSTPMRPFSSEAAMEDWQNFLAVTSDGKSPAIVWVGLGAPKQEFWMGAVSKIAPDTLFFGVGAAFDFLSGTKRRAPSWMQLTGLEWFYRLCQEPRRLWRRYLKTNIRFFLYSCKDALTSEKKIGAN